jgi:hypothetical protein
MSFLEIYKNLSIFPSVYNIKFFLNQKNYDQKTSLFIFGYKRCLRSSFCKYLTYFLPKFLIEFNDLEYFFIDCNTFVLNGLLNKNKETSK